MNEPVTQPSPDPSPHRESRIGYEITDVSPFSVGQFALGLVLMIAIVLPVLAWLFARFEAAAQRTDPVTSPLATNQTPPAPRLETDPAAELNRFRRAEDEKLSNYGWVDREKSTVRIPVERALEILATRGLPEPKGPLEPLPQKEPAP